MGRTPIVFARQSCAVLSPLAAVAASLTALVGASVASTILVTAAGIMTTFVSVRSTTGWPTAGRLALGLVPAAILSAGSAPGTVAVMVTAALIGAAWLADHRGRRTRVRVHAGARAWRRPGSIAVATAVIAAVEVILTAVLA